MATTAPQHADDARAAIAAGKDVYSEWPLTTTTEVAGELADLAKARGVRHIIGLQRRLAPHNRYLTDLLDQGFEELEAAEMELTKTVAAPSGRLRVSLPLVGMLLMPVVGDFMKAHPAIQLDLDFTDRLVDVIEKGFDVVIRTGPAVDSRLMRRSLGRFTGVIVASPGYLDRRGLPVVPSDLADHDCLRQRSPASGKLHVWPLPGEAGDRHVVIPETMSANTIEPLIHLAERGFGIACLPPFAVSSQIGQGTLVALLDGYVQQTGELAALWPTSRQLSPKIRAFVTFLVDHLEIGEGRS